MALKELEEIRSLFERAEAESLPDRKLFLLEEALDLSDDVVADNPESSDLAIVSKLRQSHLRRLLAQLTSMRSMEIGSWFNYIKLFLLRVEPEVKSILSNDQTLATSYRKFMDLWRNELMTALERAQ